MSSYYNLLASKKRATFLPSLLLDLYPSASVAYSLRKLRTAYSGSAIRVRRSSDNTEQDIGFVGGDLDTQSLLDFVGYNIWTYSEDLSQASYLKNRLNTTGTPPYINVETAPDGTLTGDKLIEDTTLASHYASRSTTAITNATDYNISVYLKQGERTKVFVSSNISGIAEACDIDLTNGNTSNNTFVNTPVVTSEANGWYRFSVTITSGTTSSTIPIRIGLNNGTTTSYTGDGTSGAYVWGFQLSQTSTVKPYQKTVADASRNGFVTTWYDQSTNGNNATQATAINQPNIVSAGVVEIQNSKPSLYYSGTKKLGTSYVLTHPFSMFVTARRSAFTGTTGLVATQRVGNISAGNFAFFTEGSFLKLRHPVVIEASIADTANLFLGYSGRVGNVGYVGINNSALNNSATLTVTQYTQNVGIGGALASADRLWNGYISEVVMYSSDNSASRTPIETNINSFYTIY